MDAPKPKDNFTGSYRIYSQPYTHGQGSFGRTQHWYCVCHLLNMTTFYGSLIASNCLATHQSLPHNKHCKQFTSMLEAGNCVLQCWQVRGLLGHDFLCPCAFFLAMLCPQWGQGTGAETHLARWSRWYCSYWPRHRHPELGHVTSTDRSSLKAALSGKNCKGWEAPKSGISSILSAQVLLHCKMLHSQRTPYQQGVYSYCMQHTTRLRS